MFERARELDMSPDMERSEVMRVKALQKISDINDDDSVENPQDPKQSNRILGSGRRYGCEICGHYFGKKFNLDRHNRSIHKRGTPEDFPNNSESIDQQITLKTEPEQECAVSVSVYNTQPEIEEISVRKKKRSKPNTLFLAGLKNRVKCTFCKKFFKKGSLARHMIIHTGKKNFTCNVQTCKRAFFQKSDLVRHEVSFKYKLSISIETFDYF